MSVLGQKGKYWVIDIRLSATPSLRHSLNEKGYKAVSPDHTEWFKMINEPASEPSSNWSERHIAYAAGLGTFSLNDAFITEKGIAGQNKKTNSFRIVVF